MKRKKRLKLYTTLRRSLDGNDRPYWELIGEYKTMKEAEKAANKLSGVWKWCGPSVWAQKMLDDPDYNPDYESDLMYNSIQHTPDIDGSKYTLGELAEYTAAYNTPSFWLHGRCVITEETADKVFITIETEEEK